MKRLSNAVRASLGVRGGCVTGFFAGAFPEDAGATSRATVTRGLKSSQVFAASLGEMRTGTGFKHWNRVDGSKCVHCLQQ